MANGKHTRPAWRYAKAAAAMVGLLALVVAAAMALQAFAADADGGRLDTSAATPSAGAPGSGPPGTSAGPSSSAPTSAPPTSGPVQRPPAAPTYFKTVGPHAKLPSGATCAGWVRARPRAENKAVNASANRATGHKVPTELLSGDSSVRRTLASRIDGNFTGTTQEIIRWAACKWGFDEDLMKAQIAIESWWRQDTLGDFHEDPSRCAPGHALGVDGKAGLCPESYGLMQTRYPYMTSAFPGVLRSSAMNVDVGFAILRSCFEGNETWLNTVERGREYAAGDLVGCMGRWFSGRWYTQGANDYIARVKDYLRQRIWTTPTSSNPDRTTGTRSLVATRARRAVARWHCGRR